MMSWSLIALAGGRGGPAGAEPPANRLAIVVAQESPIRSLTHFELKKLYLGAHIEDAAGERIMPFNQPLTSPDRLAFESRVLGMTPDEVARYWIDRKIRGESGAPKAVSPVDLLQRLVSRLVHSIAYVRVGQMLPQVRPIAIDGRLPADDDYKLVV
ncbi:MAG: hypothetical protein ABW217_04450 [Polyangiaceae bacterium]